MTKSSGNTTLSESKTNSLIVLWQKRKALRWALRFLFVLMAVGLFAPLLANEKPLFMSYRGEIFFPAFWDMNPFADKNFYTLKDKNGTTEKLQLDILDWKNLNMKQVLWCPVPYSPGKSDYGNSNFVSPFADQQFNSIQKMPIRFRHFLGTGVRGEDVLAGIIHGTRISLLVGLCSMLLAALIGLTLGALAGYFGDFTFRTSRVVLVFCILGIGLGFFYAFYVRSFQLSDSFASSGGQGWLEMGLSCALFAFVLFIFIRIGKWIEALKIGTKSVEIPIDSIISRGIEITISLPGFILILSLAAITKASVLNLIFIIAFTSWTSIARLTRAEILRIKKLDYIQAAKALGYSESRIIVRHALLNGFAPALVAIAFGIASTILIESSLSFLGIGLPLETVTWGSMLSEGRSNFSAWWMTVFPGIAIFLTVSSYNFLGDALREMR